MANHSVLQELGDPAAWIFCPTRRQEKKLGFDALPEIPWSCAIQYKSITRRKEWLHVAINQTQLETLLSRFWERRLPYVFYAFAEHPSYQAVQSDFAEGGYSQFFESTIFFSAHHLPEGCTGVRWRDEKLFPLVRGKEGEAMDCWTGPELIRLMLEKQLGFVREHAGDGVEEKEVQRVPSEEAGVSPGKAGKKLVQGGALGLSVLVTKKTKRAA